MARRDHVQQAIDKLVAIRDDPTSAGGLEVIEAALGHKSNLVVALAAQIVGEHELESLAPLLVQAFERCLTDPVKRDPSCRAKVAIARALTQLRHDAETVFRRGARHVQREPVWGGSEDTAPELRAICIAALLEGQYIGAFIDAAELLADPERLARIGAAHAIARSGNVELGVPLLRLKVLTSEADGEVLSACFLALLALDPESSLPHVATFLGDARSFVREAAAMALGESRLAGAFLPLRELAEKSDKKLGAADRRVALVAMAMLRNEETWAYLIGLIADADIRLARFAADALAAYRHDTRLRDRVRAAADACGDAPLRAYVTDLVARE